MRGIVLAGGMGSRLYPLTRITNKNLLPIYNKPMIAYPIEFLVASGVTEIMIVCGGNCSGDFLRILGNGEQFGLKHLHYAYQADSSGILDALSLAESFAGKDPVCVIFGDNIFEKPVRTALNFYMKDPTGAMIFGIENDRPERYGVIEKDDHGNIIRVIEKPAQPCGNLIATGLYVYDNKVWDFLKKADKSSEITTINNMYAETGDLMMALMGGWWTDCAEDFDTYLDASIKVRELGLGKNQVYPLKESILKNAGIS